jgi:hypothetical protein
MYDPKPDAPAEIRGPFGAIETNVPGIRISERMPRTAKVMKDCTVLRGFHHTTSDHFAAAHWVLTGYYGSTAAAQQPKNPSFGSVASLLLGARKPEIVPYVDINDGGFGYHGAAFLGPRYHPLRAGTDSYGREGVQFPSADIEDFKFQIDEGRMGRRRGMLGSLDAARRSADEADAMGAMDPLKRQAMEMIFSRKTYEAFDVEKEPAKVRERYSKHNWCQQALLARRLVESGVTFVTCNTGGWDDHSSIDRNMSHKLPIHDQLQASLIEDLRDRGMLKDVLVINAGEFGRSPKLNQGLPQDPVPGRDHWPNCQSVLLAGGAYRHGQVIGVSDDQGGFPISRPTTPPDLAAIIYQHLGISLETLIRDPENRPVRIVRDGEVPEELA